MTLRQYLIIMGAGTALAWSSVMLIISNADPFKTRSVIFFAFYASLFLALTGTFSLIGFSARVALFKERLVVSRQVAVSFRQAVLLSFLVVLSLFLKSRSLLTAWNVLLLIAALTTLEFFFISARIKNSS